jgi:hypothetical protein
MNKDWYGRGKRTVWSEGREWKEMRKKEGKKKWLKEKEKVQGKRKDSLLNHEELLEDWKRWGSRTSKKERKRER